MTKINEIAMQRIEQAAHAEAKKLDLRSLGLHQLSDWLRQLTLSRDFIKLANFEMVRDENN